ncbi:MAG: hypothetical protein CMP86_04630 [Gammaproteobacteria bacterium]|nr:hypothetical protein [Gammaproteobacteria bacterium]
MQIRRLLLTLSILLTPLASAAGTSEWIPITIKDGKLLVPSSFAGIEGHSIIDTGSNQSAIRSRFLRKNNLLPDAADEVTVNGFFEKQKRRLHKNLPVNLLGVETQFAHLHEVTLNSAKTQLLIGGDFLAQFIFQFDYPNQRMRWLIRDTLDLHALSNVPSRTDKQTTGVLAKVLLNDRQALWVTVDTGAKSGLWIERSLAAKRSWLAEGLTTLKRAKGINGSGAIEQFRLPSVKLGEFESTNTLVSVAAKDQDHAMFERTRRPGSKIQGNVTKSRGLLSWDVLQDFVVTIDYRIGKIHLEPAATS